MAKKGKLCNYGYFLCKQSEYSQWSCNKLLQYGGTKVRKNSDVVRQKFGTILISPYDGIIQLREESDQQIVFEAFKKKDKSNYNSQ